MRRCLQLQLTWLALAIFYNVISIYLLKNGLTPLKNGDPEMTLFSLLVFTVLIGLGYAKQYRPYTVLGAALTTMLLIVGVGSHLYAAMSSGILVNYLSTWSWLAALLINIFGVTAFLLGLNVVRRTRIKPKEYSL